MRRSARLEEREEAQRRVLESFLRRKKRACVFSSDEEDEPPLRHVNTPSKAAALGTNNFTKVHNSYNSECRAGRSMDVYEHDFIDDSDVNPSRSQSDHTPSLSYSSGQTTPSGSEGSGSDVVANQRRPSRQAARKTAAIKSDGEDTAAGTPYKHAPLTVATGDSEEEGGVVCRSAPQKRRGRQRRKVAAALLSSSSSESEGGRKRRTKRRKVLKPESDDDTCSTVAKRQPSSRAKRLQQAKEIKSQHLLNGLWSSWSQTQGCEAAVTLSPNKNLLEIATQIDTSFSSAKRILFPDSSSSGEDDWIVSDNDEGFGMDKMDAVAALSSLVDPSPASEQAPPSLLHQAVRGGSAALPLKDLLPELCPELELKDSQGFTPLMVAAEIGDKEAVSILLDFGASIDCCGEDGTSPLHLAALSGWEDCVEELIARGHRVDCRDSQGWPPLLYAHFQRHEECVLALMRAGPGQLYVLSNLLRRGSHNPCRNNATVIRSLLVSLAHHESYHALFNGFISAHLDLLDEDGFHFMRHCMALLSFENKQAWLARKKATLQSFVVDRCDSASLPALPRDGLLQSSLDHLTRQGLSPVQCWGNPLYVTFLNEAGICSGPRKEFWACFSHELSNGEGGLLTSSGDGGQLSLQPCTVFAKYCPKKFPTKHLHQLELVGMLMASALFHGDTLDLCLSRPLIKQVPLHPPTPPPLTHAQWNAWARL